MKAIILGLAMALTGVAAFADEPVPVKEVAVTVQDVYVPGGFDANSDVYVIVSGVFPNSCYRWKDATVTHDKQANIHEVRSTALVSQGMCLMVLVPFTKEVRLGQLGAGDHRVRFMSGDGTYLEKTIVIE